MATPAQTAAAATAAAPRAAAPKAGATKPAGGPPAAPAKPPAPAAPTAPPKDLRPAIQQAARLLAVALGALAAVAALLAGAPLDAASGRGLMAWFLVLALGRLVRAFAGSSHLAPTADKTLRPPRAAP